MLEPRRDRSRTGKLSRPTDIKTLSGDFLDACRTRPGETVGREIFGDEGVREGERVRRGCGMNQRNIGPNAMEGAPRAHAPTVPERSKWTAPRSTPSSAQSLGSRRRGTCLSRRRAAVRCIAAPATEL